MLNCYKKEKWFNPLYVYPDGQPQQERYINAFYVFDKTGIILKHDYGWFSEYIGFEINIPCVKKLKVDLNCKTAYLIPSQRIGDKTYDVYIPAFCLGLKEPEYSKNGTWITKTIKTNFEGIWFTQHKYLEHLTWDIWAKMEKCIKELTHYNLGEHPDIFDKNLKELKKLRKKWDDAKQYIKDYTVEMAIEEGF